MTTVPPLNTNHHLEKVVDPQAASQYIHVPIWFHIHTTTHLRDIVLSLITLGAFLIVQKQIARLRVEAGVGWGLQPLAIQTKDI